MVEPLFFVQSVSYVLMRSWAERITFYRAANDQKGCTTRCDYALVSTKGGDSCTHGLLRW